MSNDKTAPDQPRSNAEKFAPANQQDPKQSAVQRSGDHPKGKDLPRGAEGDARRASQNR